MKRDVHIAAIECWVFRAPIANPVVTSFGAMRDRPALFVRVLSTDGHYGWGEIWCNFPPHGAEYRARLIETIFAPLLASRPFESPRAAFDFLTVRTEVLALQTGEPGPFAQAIAGLDMAVWDMVARRAGQPLYICLGGTPRDRVPVYASGLNPDRPEALARRRFDQGYRRFKLKVGFGEGTDMRNLQTLRETFGPDTPIMTDANQAWGFDEAVAMSEALVRFNPVWLEEPLRADTPLAQWSALTQRSRIPLALGENLRGRDDFAAMVDHGGVRFLQPDLGKWGGFTGCLDVAHHAAQRAVTLCPHWLGGGIGLIASLHWLAAIGGSGWLEVDANDNPLRDEAFDDFPAVADGDMLLPQKPGLGVDPDLAALQPFRIPL